MISNILSLSIHGWLLRFADLLQWAASSLQGPGLMLVAVADSSFLSLPEGNDLLIVALSINSTWSRMGYYVAMTIVGSICGCLLLYTLGRRGGAPLLRKKFPVKDIERAERLFKKFGLFTVAVPCILPPPCPFKIFVLSAGVFRLKTSHFILAVVLGRTVRYTMWGTLAVLYGNAFKVYLEHNLKWLGTSLFGIFLAAGITMGYLYWRRLKQFRRESQSGQAE